MSVGAVGLLTLRPAAVHVTRMGSCTKGEGGRRSRGRRNSDCCSIAQTGSCRSLGVGLTV